MDADVSKRIGVVVVDDHPMIRDVVRCSWWWWDLERSRSSRRSSARGT